VNPKCAALKLKERLQRLPGAYKRLNQIFCDRIKANYSGPQLSAARPDFIGCFRNTFGETIAPGNPNYVSGPYPTWDTLLFLRVKPDRTGARPCR
jgi:hypothetical protein